MRHAPTQRQIDMLLDAQVKSMQLGRTTLRAIGLIMVIVSFTIFCVIGFSINTPHLYIWVLNLLLFGYGVFVVFLPNVFQYFNFDENFLSPYRPAPIEKVLACKHRIHTLNQTQWTQYVEQVEAMGRALTNEECDLILEDGIHLS